MVAGFDLTPIAGAPALGSADGPALGTAGGPAPGSADGPALGTADGPALATADGTAVRTKVNWQGEAQIFGRLASVAGGLLEPLGRKQLQKLIDGLQAALT
jgi:carbon monoxide dehydrogenase subunit G